VIPMKYKELQKKTVEELKKENDNATLDLMRYHAKVATNSIGKESGKINLLRKTIARIKTLQHKGAGKKQ